MGIRAVLLSIYVSGKDMKIFIVVIVYECGEQMSNN